MLNFFKKKPKSEPDSKNDNVSQDSDAERSKGGSLMLQHKVREDSPEFSAGNGELMDIISDHIEKNIGKIDFVYHEMLSTDIHLDINVIKPTPERPYYTLVTMGMSEKQMTVPEQFSKSMAYVELITYLPADWKISAEDFEDENNYWPLRLLKTCARLPHEYKTFLWMGHTVPHDEKYSGYSKNTKLGCVYISLPYNEPTKFATIKVSDEKTIFMLMLQPIYKDEAEYKLEFGSDAFEEKYEESEIGFVINPNRKSCVG